MKALKISLVLDGPHLATGLAEAFTDGTGQIGRRFQNVGDLRLIVLPGVLSPLAIILGVMIIVLNPMVQEFDELFRKRQRCVAVGMTVVMIVPMVVAMVMIMAVVVVVIMVVVMRHMQSPESLSGRFDEAFPAGQGCNMADLFSIYAPPITKSTV